MPAFLFLIALLSPQLWYRQPAAHWSEALPIGNGRLAAMVYGDVAREHLQLNEETIYAGKRLNRDNPEARAAIPVIRKLILAGKVVEAEALAEKSMLAIPRRQPPYEPLGDLALTFANSPAPQNYKRSLDLYDGVATVEYQSGASHYKRLAFASYPDNVIVVHLEATGAEKLHFTVDLNRAADATTSIDASFGAATLVLRGRALPPTQAADIRESRPQEFASPLRFEFCQTARIHQQKERLLKSPMHRKPLFFSQQPPTFAHPIRIRRACGNCKVQHNIATRICWNAIAPTSVHSRQESIWL